MIVNVIFLFLLVVLFRNTPHYNNKLELDLNYLVSYLDSEHLPNK